MLGKIKIALILTTVILLAVVFLLLNFVPATQADWNDAIYKADFETGWGGVGYIDNGSGSVERSTDIAHRGNYSVKITHRDNATTAIAKGTTVVGLDTYSSGYFYFPSSWHYWNNGPNSQTLKFLVQRGVETSDREWYMGPYRNWRSDSNRSGYDPDDYHMLAFTTGWGDGDEEWTTDGVNYTEVCATDGNLAPTCDSTYPTDDTVYRRYWWFYVDYPITEDEWHYIEMHIHHEDPEDGYVELWIDDQYVKIINLNFDTSRLTDRYRWSLNDSTGGSTGQYYYWDDVAISNSRIGPINGGIEPSTYLLPDLSHDSDINVQDFSLFQSYWSSQNLRADFNDDGLVSSQDFAIMLSTWGNY